MAIKKFTTQRSTYIDPATGEEKKIPKITGKLVSLNSHNPEALYNLGTFCLQDKKFELGVEILSKSLKLKDAKETRLNLATCYKFCGNFKKAREILKSIIRDYPEFPLGYNNLGLMLYDIRDIPSARKLYEKAIELNPKYGDARWNYSLALNLQYFTDLELAAGNNQPPPSVEDFQKAMKYFEARFEKTSPVNIAQHDNAKRWYGEPLKEGESLMLLCEQGVGDIFQFMRYAYNFRPDQVKLHIPENVKFLVKPGYQATDTTYLDKSTYYCPMMSAAAYFPITDSPYITHLDYAAVPEEILASKKLKIGIVWKGNVEHANDANRSRLLKDFLWLKEYGDLFSLQKDGKIGNLNWIKQLKLGHWANTVGAINGLDIVVTVDTSVAHLAGAMGKPVIVLIPAIGIDWRWGELGENCVWYSSMRFARMQSMAEVERLLKEFLANGKAWGPRRYEIKPEEFSETEIIQKSTSMFTSELAVI
jgi:tetratricopeptide (TPR) repeat protein